MKTGTILAALVILCCLPGCTKEPAPPKRYIRGTHSIQIEVAEEVIVGKLATATASWIGGTPPFKITWSFPGTHGVRPSRKATSPDTITFEYSDSDGEILKTYSIQVSITDADGETSTTREGFVLIGDPLKSSPRLLRATTP